MGRNNKNIFVGMRKGVCKMTVVHKEISQNLQLTPGKREKQKMLCKRCADCMAFFLFKIANMSFSAIQRNAQPLPPAMISGGICHQQAFSRNSGNEISAKYAILRKIALLTNLTPELDIAKA